VEGRPERCTNIGLSLTPIVILIFQGTDVVLVS